MHESPPDRRGVSGAQRNRERTAEDRAILDFPNSPITGATFTAPNGLLWVYDGAKWANGTAVGTTYAPINSPSLTGNPTAPNPPVGDADTSVATTSFVTSAVQTATGTALNNVGRNLLHNPLYAVQQRGSGPWTTAATYTLDRWLCDLSVSTVSVTPLALADADRAAIGDEAATTAYQSVCTGTAGAGDYVLAAQQRIEGVRRLAGKSVTISFWAKATTGTPRVGLEMQQVFGFGGSPSAAVSSIGAQNFLLSTTWTRYSTTIAVPSATGKTFGTTVNTDFTTLSFWQSAGATLNPRAGLIGVQSYTLQLWGVQLEVGSVATPLDYGGSPQQQLAQCQRFFYAGRVDMQGGAYVANVSCYAKCDFPVTMRAAGTMVAVGSGTSIVNVSSIAVSANAQIATATGLATAAGNWNISQVFTVSADL